MTYTQLLEFIERMNLPLGAQLSRGSMIRIAQTAAADLAVMGTFSGSAKNLKITVRILDIKTLKLSGGISANGPLSVLPQMENELACLMSLGGLAIAIGMMVDGSVVMMEHVFSHLATPDAVHREWIREEIAGGAPTPYDAEHDRLFVTGKYWPKIYEVELIPTE